MGAVAILGCTRPTFCPAHETAAGSPRTLNLTPTPVFALQTQEASLLGGSLFSRACVLALLLTAAKSGVVA